MPLEQFLSEIVVENADKESPDSLSGRLKGGTV